MQHICEVLLFFICIGSVIIFIINILAFAQQIFNDNVEHLKESFCVMFLSFFIILISFYPLSPIIKSSQIDRAIETGEIKYSPSGNLIISDNLYYIIYGK